MAVVLVVNFEFSATIFTFIGVGEWIIFDNAFFALPFTAMLIKILKYQYVVLF